MIMLSIVFSSVFVSLCPGNPKDVLYFQCGNGRNIIDVFVVLLCPIHYLRVCVTYVNTCLHNILRRNIIDVFVVLLFPIHYLRVCVNSCLHNILRL